MQPVHTQIRLRAAVFLDRDGVIIEDTGYLHKVEDIRYIPGSLEAIAQLNRQGIPVVIVTNQSEIGRGYYTWQNYEQVQAQIALDLAQHHAGWLDASLACACLPEADHPFRKPNPGMLQAAAGSLALDLARSWLVGDKLADIQAAHRAPLRGAIHVLTGKGAAARSSVQQWAAENPSFEVRYAETLAAAIPLLNA